MRLHERYEVTRNFHVKINIMEEKHVQGLSKRSLIVYHKQNKRFVHRTPIIRDYATNNRGRPILLTRN